MLTRAQLVPDHSSSYFRGGSRVIGTQQSDQQIYTVDVEIKNVDMTESYLCGYLKIKGTPVFFHWSTYNLTPV